MHRNTFLASLIVLAVTTGAHAATLRVPGEFSTVQGALDAANRDDIVEVSAGVYTERLVFVEGVTLRAEASAEVVIRGHAELGPVLTVENCGTGVVQGITFENSEDSDSGEDVIGISVVLVKSSSVTFRDCTIRHGRRNGMTIEGGAAVIENCRIVDNGLNGITVQGEAEPTLTGTTLRGNAQHGLYFLESSKGTASKNEVLSNGHNGIVVSGIGTAPLLDQNTIKKNTYFGILYSDGAGGVAKGNTANENGSSGISVFDASVSPELRDNTCLDNEYRGIYFPAEPGLVARNNEFHRNGEIGEPELRLLLYEEKDFETLEAIAARLRDEKTRFHNGNPQLFTFYNAFQYKLRKASEEEEAKTLRLLSEWQEAYPNSITWRIVLGKAYERFGWRERGGGYVSSVTEKGWDGLSAYMNKSLPPLLDALKLDQTDMELYPALIDTLVGLGTDMRSAKGQEIVELLREKDPELDLTGATSLLYAVTYAAMNKDPLYDPIYYSVATFLLPRWHGSSGEVERFAEFVANATRDQAGDRLYRVIARNVRYMLGEEDFYIKTNFTWEQEKRGFLDQLSRYPDSGQWNLFAHFAFMQRDREATAKAVPHIESSVELSVWKYQSLYEQVRQWAIEDAPYPLSIDLVEAVEDNNLSAVTQLLEKGASPLVYTEYKWPILTRVVVNENLPIFRALVEAGADVHGLDRHGHPLTHYAVRTPDAEFLRLILEAGADPNEREPAGNTPMSIAIKKGNAQAVPLLIEYGADLTLTVGPSRYAPIHHAAKHRGPKVIQVLIDHGADVNMKMIDDWTPLMISANNGKMGTTRVLLENGADLTAMRGESKTAKAMAKEEGYMDVVRLIETYENK